MATFGSATITLGVRYIVLSDGEWKYIRRLCAAQAGLEIDPSDVIDEEAFAKSIVDEIDGKRAFPGE